MATLVQILTEPAARRQAMRQLSVAGVATGAAAIAVVTWLAVH